VVVAGDPLQSAAPAMPNHQIDLLCRLYTHRNCHTYYAMSETLESEVATGDTIACLCVSKFTVGSGKMFAGDVGAHPGTRNPQNPGKTPDTPPTPAKYLS